MRDLELRNEEQRAAITPETAVLSLAPTESEIRLVRRSLRFLSRRNPARRLAEAALAGERLEPELVREVLARLGRLRATRFVEHELAAWALGVARLTEDERQQVLGQFCPLMTRGWRSGWWLSLAPFGVTVALFAALAALIEYLLHTDTPLPSDIVYVVTALVVSACATAFAVSIAPQAICWLRDRPREAAVTCLGRLGFVRAVPALARALHFDDGSLGAAAVQRASWRALPAVLQRLAEDDRDWLDAGTTGLLAKVLRYSGPWRLGSPWLAFRRPPPAHEALVLAILEALGRVGDGRVLRDVEYVAAHARTQAMRETAGRVAPVIRERAKRATEAASLLRPASAPDAETLLRPASAPGEADPAVLLRPAEGPEATGDER
jgi:hypothetical protein